MYQVSFRRGEICIDGVDPGRKQWVLTKYRGVPQGGSQKDGQTSCSCSKPCSVIVVLRYDEFARQNRMSSRDQWDASSHFSGYW